MTSNKIAAISGCAASILQSAAGKFTNKENRVNPRLSQKFRRVDRNLYLRMNFLGAFAMVFGTRFTNAAPTRSRALAFLSVTAAAAFIRALASESERLIMLVKLPVADSLDKIYLSTANAK